MDSGKQTNRSLSVRVSERLEDPQWDRFVAACPDGHHVQTSLWALVKASLGWKPIRILVTKNGQIVAGSQLLIRSYPLIGSMGYVTKGPLCSSEYHELAMFLIKQLRCIGQAHNCRLLAIQPTNCGHYISALLAEQGFRHSALKLAPVASILIDLTIDIDKILARIKQKTRQYINRSRREGIAIHEATRNDFDTFYSLHLNTGKRQRFMPYPKRYYETMKRVLEPHGHFKILMAKYGDEAVSGLLLIPYGDTVTTKIIGWSGLYRELRPNEALYWGSILWAKKHGYKFIDLEGVNPIGARCYLQGKPMTKMISHSPDKIKYGFGGKVVLYPEAYDLVYNPVLRWFYYRIRPHVTKQSAFSKALDFFRKR